MKIRRSLKVGWRGEKERKGGKRGGRGSYMAETWLDGLGLGKEENDGGG